METIHYVLADPSGNTTILVLDEIPTDAHAALASKLLDPHCVGAEQVAYVSRPENATVRIDMMGGEFCGNASRSAAAYLLSLTGEERHDYDVSCSGCDTILHASVSRKDDEYEAFITMPKPTSMDMIPITVGEDEKRFYRVELPGITHYVHVMPSLKDADKESLWQAVYNCATLEPCSAFGMDLVDRKTLSMIPAVYVPKTDTLYWEQSCGSGSAATAAALAKLSGHDISCEIRQPGGYITIEATCSDDAIKVIRIGGFVKLSDVRTVEVDI